MRRLLVACSLIACADVAFADARVTLCAVDTQSGPGVNLATALAEGGRITFGCPAGTTIRVTRAYPLPRPVEIDGERRITLDAAGATDMFRHTVGTGSLVLRNITLRRGRAMPGRPGMITGGMDVTLDRVEMVDTSDAIRLETGRLSVSDSQFFGNRGPVLVAPHLEVKRSSFAGTVGQLFVSAGGAVTLESVEVAGLAADSDRGSSFTSCTLEIRNSTFRNQWSTSGSWAGGALLSACKTTIANTVFANNRAANGGALFFPAAAPEVRLTAVTFTDNRALEFGGAIAFEPSQGLNRSLTIHHGQFRGNRAHRGGAISLGVSDSNDNLLQGVALTFKANSAADAGGAIYARSAGATLSRAIFLENRAERGGAALLIEGTAMRPLILANALVARNAGAQGAAVQAISGEVVNATIANNTSSGVSAAAGLRFQNTVIAENRQGNCARSTPAGGVEDRGANVQFPGGDCPATMASADPKLDSFYVPAPDSPLRSAGDNRVCLAAPVNARDLYGQTRPRGDRCTIGAVEGDIENLVRRMKSDRGRRVDPGHR
jgi:predicted outer membrane repeat protein